MDIDRAYSGEVWRRKADGLEVRIESGSVDNAATASSDEGRGRGERICLPPFPRASGLWERVSAAVD
jgi:hypothetical protein